MIARINTQFFFLFFCFLLAISLVISNVDASPVTAQDKENKPAYADGFNSPAWKEFLKKFELHPGEMYFAWRAVSEVHRIGIGAELPYLRGLIV
ncbi:hypothetical protein GYMLUDRAFT_903327 [Collybiopsis luxurians FD-317 M1]|uniref:Uncharacterized protein n=1 Tax=Collybiopsis luxurians FD-317 M1 TaxID=944289 RepID=A0A0D0AUZ1_9AGAR|nr:hypothetical protein GYMLUDRAFT_903327 [Collybiopsis luxurians FD-317 M1]